MPKKKKSPQESNGFSDKLAKKLPTGFVEETDALGTEDLKKVLVDSEKNILCIEREIDADQMLNNAKAVIKDLAGPYREAIACQNAKIKYVLYCLEQRGDILVESDKDGTPQV